MAHRSDSVVRTHPGIHGGIAVHSEDAESLDLEIGDLVEDEDGHQVGVETIGELSESTERRLRRVERCRDTICARSIGPYSIVTNQPLRHATYGGQELSIHHLASLEARGAGSMLLEAVTAKSDDRHGRYRMYENIVRGTPALDGGVSEATLAFERTLVALGLDVGIEAKEPTLRISTPEAMRSLASGPVLEAATLDDDEVPIEGGLFCEALFGDIGSDARREQFAIIELPRPVLHVYFRDVAAALLGIPTAEFDARLYGSGQPELLEALVDIDLAALEQREDRAGELARTLRANRVEPRDLMIEALPVLPPDLRPIVKLDDGRWAVSDLNDLYLEVLTLSRRLRIQLENRAESFLVDTTIELQRAVDALLWNGAAHPPVRSDSGRKLRSLSEAFHFDRILNKRVDYSAIGSVVPALELSPTTVALPRSAAFDLFAPFLYSELEASGHATSIKQAKQLVDDGGRVVSDLLESLLKSRWVAVCPMAFAQDKPVPFAGLQPIVWNHSAIGLHPDVATRLGAAWRKLCIHVPLTADAVNEVRALSPEVGRGQIDAALERGGTGWISRAALGSAPVVLAEAALRHEADLVDDPLTRLMLGRHPRD